MTPFDTLHMTSYSQSTITLVLVGTISEIQRCVAANPSLQLRATLSEASRSLAKNCEDVICVA